MEEDTKSMLDAIRGFKPTQSAIELKRLQTIRKSKDKTRATDTLLSAIQELKLVRRKAKESQEERSKLRLKREQNENPPAEDNSDESEDETKVVTHKKLIPIQ